MLRDILTLSALILVVLLVRAMFKNRVPKRMLYCLWLVVLLKLCLPGTLFSLPVLPAEDAAAPVLRTELPTQTAPASQQPAQTAAQPQTPAQPPVSPAQEAAKPAAKPLTTTQILQIVWAGGSALLGFWLFGAWMVFTVRLRKSRKFLGKHGKANIYVSNRVKSPCLAGLIPAVYLTQDVLQTGDTELILRHELTHLHHLDPVWSLCRTAAVVVYWWNPFIWLAAILSKRDAELACDEAVAAKLSESKRLAYARAILAQAPRKTAALSLAGPPVKERILFLTKKQCTSALCVILALLLVVSATGCSFAELTQQKSGEITLPGNTSTSAEPAQNTPLLNNRTYDASQPLQAWELTRADGVQTGMTRAQIEAIVGPLTPNEYGVLMDSQDISYRFWDRGDNEPRLMKMDWAAGVENGEYAYDISPDAPAFRGICLGDTLDDVLAKFPCADTELKGQQAQDMYGQEGDANYAALHLIAENQYSLLFTVDGQWCASIDFSGDQQRVYHIVIYTETYWQEANQAGADIAAPAQTMTLAVSSGGTYTLSDEDTESVGKLFSIDSMTPTASDSESVCAYQFDVGNRSYLLDESLGLAEAVVRVDADHYEYYQKRLTNAESEILKAIITRCRQSTLQTAIIQQVSDDSITVEHIILLNPYLAEDMQIIEYLNIPPEEYQYGYYRRDSGEIYTYAVDPDTPVTIYDIRQKYGAGEDRLYTFETWQDFVTAVQANEGLIIQPYTLTIQDGVVTRIAEKFYN